MKNIELAFLFFSIKHCHFYLFIFAIYNSHSLFLQHHWKKIQCIYFIYHLCRLSHCFYSLVLQIQCCKENSVCTLHLSFSLGWLDAGWRVIPRWYWVNTYLISLISDGLLSRKAILVYVYQKPPKVPFFNHHWQLKWSHFPIFVNVML